MVPRDSFLRWKEVIPSGPLTVDDVANLIASFVLADVKDGICVNDS